MEYKEKSEELLKKHKDLLDRFDLLAPYYEETIFLLKQVDKLATQIDKTGDNLASRIREVTAEIVVKELTEVKEVKLDLKQFRDVIREITDELKKDVKESYPTEVVLKDIEKLKIEPQINLDKMKEIEALLTKLLDGQTKGITIKQVSDGVEITNRDKNDAIPVKLVTADGKSFYDAIARLMGSGGGGQRNFATNVQTDSGDANIEYVGKAKIGTLTNAAAWQIRKIDTTAGTIVTYADSDDKFNNVFDDREGLTYG